MSAFRSSCYILAVTLTFAPLAAADQDLVARYASLTSLLDQREAQIMAIEDVPYDLLAFSLGGMIQSMLLEELEGLLQGRPQLSEEEILDPSGELTRLHYALAGTLMALGEFALKLQLPDVANCHMAEGLRSLRLAKSPPLRIGYTGPSCRLEAYGLDIRSRQAALLQVIVDKHAKPLFGWHHFARKRALVQGEMTGLFGAP